jgi:hypothetical protein
MLPDLMDPNAIAAGASEYAEMCTGCHLAPGMEDNEMPTGLYPYPLNFADRRQKREARSADGERLCGTSVLDH